MIPPKCGYVPQLPRLLSASLAENATLGRLVDLDGAIRAAVLEDDVSEFPVGVETLIGPRGTRLSGGRRLRVAAARALAKCR